MFVIRLLALLALVAIAGGIGAYLLTGRRQYLSFSWRVLRWTVVVALLIFVLLILERVAVLPL